MKAVITAIRGEYAAALLCDGTVQKIRNKGYRAGQEIDYVIGSPVKKARSKLSAAAFILLILLLLAGAGTGVYTAPYCRVSMDVNPSILYTVNRIGRVIGIEAADADAGDIAAYATNAGALHKPIARAVELTLEGLRAVDVVKTGQHNAMVLAVSANNERYAASLAVTLKRSVEQALADVPIRVQCMAVTKQQAIEAEALGTTPGRLALVNQLAAVWQDADTPFDQAEWLFRPVAEVMNAVQAASGGTAQPGETGGHTQQQIPAVSSAGELPQYSEPPLQPPEKQAVPYIQ